MKKFFDTLSSLFILFMIFAVAGWLYEVALTVISYGYFQNRGFLFGPWLPIYGFGGLGLYLVFGGLIKKPARAWRKALRAAAVFAVICVLSAAFELAASYLLDALGIGFTTLWDYFGETPNFEGRISLISSLRFGVIGTAALYAAVPLADLMENTKNRRLIHIVSAVLAVLFFVDLILRIPFGSNMG